MYRKFFKRPLDILLSLTALIVLSPLMVIIAILVRVKLGSPVIFKQERPGLNEKIFAMYKFRTMTDERDCSGELLPDSIRLTKLGRSLRSSSLDEIPELWNILRSDMSFIGPRPLLQEYLPFYSNVEKHRHDVRPGLTGLAQVSGRNFLDWDRRLNKDIEYINTISFIGDLTILLKTVRIVAMKKDIAIFTDKVEGNLAEIRKNKNLPLKAQQ